MSEVHIGDKIIIIDMEGEPHYKEREDVVTHIDDAGQIHGAWRWLRSYSRIRHL